MGLIFEKISSELVMGLGLAKAMENSKKFSEYEIRAIEIGENTGETIFISQSLSVYFEKKNEQKRQIISSLSYPIIVMITAFVVVFFMLKYVVPMFEDIFSQNNVELPFITQVIINLSQFLNHYIILFLFIPLLLGIFHLIKDKRWFNKYSGLALVNLPVIGEYIKGVYLTRFLHTMMLLTKAKIPITEALKMVEKLILFYPINSALNTIIQELTIGEKISSSFGKHKIFSKKVIAMLVVAEETNQNEYIFEKLYQQTLNEVEYKSKSLTNLLNPILTLFVGFIVGLILIAMYLPMFKLSSVLG